MNSLEKQQKKSFYTITLGYEKYVHQHIIKNFTNGNEIPVVNKNLKDDNFTPGEDFIKKIMKMMAARTVSAGLEKSFPTLQKLLVNNMSIKGPLRPIANKITNLGAYLYQHTMLTQEEKSHILNMIVNYAILALSRDKQICGDLNISSFLANAFSVTLINKMDMRIRGKNRFNLMRDHVTEFILRTLTGKQKTTFISTLTTGKAFYNRLGDVAQHLIDSKLDILKQISLYTIAPIGVTILYRGICRKIMNDVISIEIDKRNFNTIIKKLMELISDRIQHEEDYDIKERQMSFLKFRIHNKVYTNSNDVISQMHYIIKDILKNMPQNVFVEQIEYWGYEDDNALINLPNDFNNNAENSQLKGKKVKNTKNNAKKEKEREGETFDIHQILFSNHGKVDYDNQDLKTVDKLIIKYATQHTRLYNFHNRKTFARKHLFNVISRFTKPQDISPKIPHFYTLTFLNTSEENSKLYFYNENKPWFKHKQTIKGKMNLKSNMFDTYIINLFLTRMVERKMENIFDDLPKELILLEVIRPSEDKNSECKNLIVYSLKKIQKNRHQSDHSCPLPKKLTTQIDLKIQDLSKKLNKERDMKLIENKK